MSVDAVLARLEAIIPRLDAMERHREEARSEHSKDMQAIRSDINNLANKINGRITQIEIRMAGDDRERKVVARELLDRQKSRAWWVGVLAAFAGSAAAIATIAGVLSQLIYHGHP